MFSDRTNRIIDAVGVVAMAVLLVFFGWIACLDFRNKAALWESKQFYTFMAGVVMLEAAIATLLFACLSGLFVGRWKGLEEPSAS